MTEMIASYILTPPMAKLAFYYQITLNIEGAVAYQHGNTSSRTITEVKQR